MCHNVVLVYRAGSKLMCQTKEYLLTKHSSKCSIDCWLKTLIFQPLKTNLFLKIKINKTCQKCFVIPSFILRWFTRGILLDKLNSKLSMTTLNNKSIKIFKKYLNCILIKRTYLLHYIKTFINFNNLYWTSNIWGNQEVMTTDS